MRWDKVAAIGWGANLYGRQNNQSTETPELSQKSNLPVRREGDKKW